ncbi:hypothetical protein Zmor_008499 [Zophobas morio]|uniref:Uncharacterized protein n=1 Tax=Zophobas morio TaxID=2755281 RepID=A0AA38IV97_9CUCU|nr:hypothetical protein Zmor_008499 [Zophobas morio]
MGSDDITSTMHPRIDIRIASLTPRLLSVIEGVLFVGLTNSLFVGCSDRKKVVAGSTGGFTAGAMMGLIWKKGVNLEFDFEIAEGRKQTFRTRAFKGWRTNVFTNFCGFS